MTVSGSASSPKGINRTANSAIGMTSVPTTGMASRLATSVSGATRWK